MGGMDVDALKRSAAERALGYVEDGMRLGLGTGSTAAHFVDLLAAKVKSGLNVSCVPTSKQTEEQAKGLGIPLTDLEVSPFLDLTIDGADEIDDELRLIKGGGGALLREKIVATASERMIVIADDSKAVDTLGSFPLPIEVVPFGAAATRCMIELLAADVGCTGDIKLRTKADGSPFISDCGNLIFDCAFGEIEAPEALDDLLKIIPGVVENGLFIGIADRGIISGASGIKEIEIDDTETATQHS